MKNATPASELNSDDDSTLEAALEALGYINTVPVSEESRNLSGVTQYDPAKAFDGLNLFNSRRESNAHLIDMRGETQHRWQSPLKGDTYKQFEDRIPSFKPSYLNGWSFVDMLPNGDLLVIGTHHMLLRLDWESNPLWKLNLAAHHDLAISETGDIYVLSDTLRVATLEGEPVAFQDNTIVIVAPTGLVLGSISLFDAMSGAVWQERIMRGFREIVKSRGARLEKLRKIGRLGRDRAAEIPRLYEAAIRGDIEEDEGIKSVLFHGHVEDIFHSNSLQILPHAEPGLWRRGDFLVVVRNMDLIVVIDQDSKKVIWSWGQSELQGPHHATQLEDGNILIFDNGVRRMYSRILKVDPKTGEVVWKYQSTPPTTFFSKARGGCQELPNGNVLIAETNRGRAFEVTPAGEIVWNYYTDLLVQDEESSRSKEMPKRGAIYRMTRVQAPMN